MTPPPVTGHRMAQILCDASHTILWEHVSDWAESKRPGIRFSTRVGTGKKTYCASNTNKNTFKLTFGKMMVRSQLSSAAEAANWTHGREVVERKYYGGEVTPLNVLASVVCHEFAHVIQGINGWRTYGSVHNKDFYRVLDRIHASGKSDEVRDYVHQYAGDIQFMNNSSILVVEKRSVGELVTFMDQGEEYKGRILRVNRHTYSLALQSPRGGRAKVPFRLVI